MRGFVGGRPSGRRIYNNDGPDLPALRVPAFAENKRRNTVSSAR
jgi:hypothetical protein